MQKIRCLIVDDEPPAIQLLERYTDMVGQLQLVDTVQSAVRAFDLLKDQNVDLIFLDIQMPVLNGIDFIKTLKKPPAVIFTTAYREYALDGYELDIIDYLLKPITFDRFLKAIDKYRDRCKVQPIADIVEESQYFFCNINRTQHKIFFKDIQYIESLKDYVRLHLSKENLVIKGNIGSFMKQLPKEQFVRIHRSFAISMAHIQSYNQSEVNINGIKLPFGITYRAEFFSRIG